MPTFDPKFCFYWGLASVVLAFASHTGLPHSVPADTAQNIQDWASYASLLGTAVTTYLAAFSSSKTGLLVPPSPKS